MQTVSSCPGMTWCWGMQGQQSKLEARQSDEMGRLSEEHRRVAAHLDDLQSSLLGAQLHETQRFGQVLHWPDCSHAPGVWCCLHGCCSPDGSARHLQMTSVTCIAWVPSPQAV